MLHNDIDQASISPNSPPQFMNNGRNVSAGLSSISVDSKRSKHNILEKIRLENDIRALEKESKQNMTTRKGLWIAIGILVVILVLYFLALLYLYIQFIKLKDSCDCNKQLSVIWTQDDQFSSVDDNMTNIKNSTTSNPTTIPTNQPITFSTTRYPTLTPMDTKQQMYQQVHQ